MCLKPRIRIMTREQRGPGETAVGLLASIVSHRRRAGSRENRRRWVYLWPYNLHTNFTYTLHNSVKALSHLHFKSIETQKTNRHYDISSVLVRRTILSSHFASTKGHLLPPKTYHNVTIPNFTFLSSEIYLHINAQ